MVRTIKGHPAILVMLGGISKFVVFYHVKSITSKVVCEALELFYFPAYGVPEAVVSDNARVFKSKPYYNLCFKWGLKRIYPTPYPQGSLVERVNRKLKALKIYHQSQTRWDEDLSLLSLAFSSARHESTSFTPARLFLGREIRSPLEINWELCPTDLENEPDAIDKFWEKALCNLRAARRFNINRVPHVFKCSDMVVYKLNLISSKVKHSSAKMLMKWSQPVVIAKFLAANVVHLQIS
jgi:hypothetical protein